MRTLVLLQDNGLEDMAPLAKDIQEALALRRVGAIDVRVPPVIGVMGMFDGLLKGMQTLLAELKKDTAERGVYVASSEMVLGEKPTTVFFQGLYIIFARRDTILQAGVLPGSPGPLLGLAQLALAQAVEKLSAQVPISRMNEKERYALERILQGIARGVTKNQAMRYPSLAQH